MTKRNPRFLLRVGATIAVLATVATGCADSGDSKADDKTITFGVIQGWTDETGTTALLENVLEDNGYKVEIKEISDNAPMYTALANGDIDILTSSWKDKTHKDYWERYGDKLEDIGVYYEGADSFFAVPTYSKLKTVEDLKGQASDFDGRVVGIEPGAGLMGLAKTALSDYGLDGEYKLLSSSTAAMLTELKKATAAKKEIVVTMWKPFWANGAFPIRKLDDPKGSFGETEDLHVIARDGFAADHPEVAEMLKGFKLTDDQYNELEDLVANKYGPGKEQEAATEFAKANPEYVPALEAALKN